MGQTKHVLYKIYYHDNTGGEFLAYIGRTNQPLQNRLRGHFFKKPMHRVINIFNVSKIEYAEFKTVADMYLYEIYYINLLKPPLNKDDKAKDVLTVSLPSVKFTEYIPPLMKKWKAEIGEADDNYTKRLIEREAALDDLYRQRYELRQKRHNGEVTEDEYYDLLEKLEMEISFCKD